MIRPEMSRRAQIVIAFLIPVALVKTAPVWLGGGFANSAQPTQAIAMPPVFGLDTCWDERQLAAAAYIGTILDEPFDRVPMADMVTGGETAIVDLGPLDVEVSMILATESGMMALIAGEVRGVGDLIGEWRIVAIAVRKRSVTFENTLTGEQTVAKLP